MHSELDSLDQKLAQLVRLTQQLRSENHQLRQELASSLSQNRQSRDKIERASVRLEDILAQLPDKAL
jgi:cell division protein ZapB